MRNIHKSYCALIILTACILWLNCSDDGPTDSNNHVRNTDFVAQESFAFKVAVTGQSRLRLEGINGSISVAGVTAADSVIITGEKRVGSDSMADAEEYLEQLDVDVQDSAEEIFVKTDQPEETQGRSYTVDYTITLPSDLEVLIVNVNGAVTIEDVNAAVSVVNVNGLVTLDEILGSAQVTVVNGQIEAEITLPLNGTIGMTTANGEIELYIPQSTSAEFSASVGNGTINVSNLDLTNQVISSNYFSGTLGEGQGTISLSTSNGKITVTGF